MIKKPRLLMVGNFLSSQLGTRSVCEDLSEHLMEIGYSIIETSSKPGRLARLLDMLATILNRRVEYDLVYIEVYSGLAFLWAELCTYFLSLLNIPIVLALHGGGLPSFAEKHPVRVKQVLIRARIVVTPSNFIRDQLSHLRAEIQYLPNAIDISIYPFTVSENPSPRIIWLRAFHAIYQPQMAIKSFADVIKAYPTATLTMIGPDKGDGSLKKTKELVIALNLKSAVIFHDRVSKSQVSHTLKEGDIFLNTTILESFGVSVMEAALMGLPIVTTNVGELAYLWEHEKTALLVSQGDSVAMANAIKRILQEPHLAKKLSLNARHKGEQFDWSVILPLWEKLFQEISQANV